MTISDRKADHIDLCAEGDVGFAGKTTLLEGVELMHDALPELELDAIDTSLELFGKTLRAPIIIAAMTGGTERAAAINRDLAAVAEARGLGFGLGSQRPMLDGTDTSGADPSYGVRAVAPHALLLGNLGAVQARGLDTAAVADLIEAVGADAMCIHLNPAMELVQPGGDRDFRRLADTFARLHEGLDVPLIAKETGCGIGPRAAERLRHAGVEHVDVSGAGGTSWVAVETERAAMAEDVGARALGEALRDWGVPTAASVAYARLARFTTVIATGGIGSGHDIARAIALGARCVGMARPLLIAHQRGGRQAVDALLAGIERELRAIMLLVGAGDLARLGETTFVLRGELRHWLDR